jgi:hypothetical protein
MRESYDIDRKSVLRPDFHRHSPFRPNVICLEYKWQQPVLKSWRMLANYVEGALQREARAPQDAFIE